MPVWIPIAGEILKELAIGAGIYAGIEGIQWLWRKFAARRAAKAAAQAGMRALTQREIMALMAQKLKDLEAQIAHYRQLAEAARAAGDVRSARIYEVQAARLEQSYAQLASVAQVAAEKRIDWLVNLAGTAAMAGFTIEEFRQVSGYSSNMQKLFEYQAMKDASMNKYLAMWARSIEMQQERLKADERNRAFWAWYMQQKFALEQMKQQAMMMKQTVGRMRQSAGRQSGSGWAKVLQAQISGYYKALTEAIKRQRALEEFWGKVNLEQLRAMNEQQAIGLRAKWDAWLSAIKDAQERRRQLEKAVLDMLEQQQKAALESQLQREEFAMKAELERLQHMLAEHRMLLEHRLESELAQWESVLRERLTTVENLWEGAKEAMKALAEVAKVEKAKERTEKVDKVKAEWDEKYGREARRILTELAMQYLEGLKREMNLQLKPREVRHYVKVTT